jgi:hypothetical protein
MIPYVQSAASQEVPPPYKFPGVTVHAFVWEAHLDRVQAYCDRFFNLGDEKDRGFRFGAAGIWPYALLMIIDYPVMIRGGHGATEAPGEVPYSDRGVISQREAFVCLPVIRYGTAPGTQLINSTLEWALPFIVVSNPMSAVCGREMLGLEKVRADITLGESVYPDSFRARVSMHGWATLEPTAMQQVLPFLDVDTGPAVPTFRGHVDESSLWTLFRSRAASSAIGALGTVSDFIETASFGLMPTAMQTVSLKQFRDAAEPDKAVYQALVSCRAKYSGIENFRFFNENDVEITFHQEGSFGETVRFVELPPGRPSPTASGRPGSFRPKAACRFNASIAFDNTRTFHAFPVERGPGLPPTKSGGDLLAPWLWPLRGFFFGPQP